MNAWAMPLTGLRMTGPDQLTRTLPDHDRSPPSAATRVLITCHSIRPAQIRAHLPGRFIWHGTPLSITVRGWLERPLGKRYGSTWALRECSLAVPAGHVAALVGPNAAGKTTLLNLTVGLATPTSGTVTVLGAEPAGSPAALDRIAFVA